jgi:endogenous inhibitor of DNA gyrase (YacG/DUF329 family)
MWTNPVQCPACGQASAHEIDTIVTDFDVIERECPECGATFEAEVNIITEIDLVVVKMERDAL